MDLRQLVFNWMKHRRWTVSKLANRAKVSRATLYRWLPKDGGEPEGYPSVKDLERIFDALGDGTFQFTITFSGRLLWGEWWRDADERDLKEQNWKNVTAAVAGDGS